MRHAASDTEHQVLFVVSTPPLLWWKHKTRINSNCRPSPRGCDDAVDHITRLPESSQRSLSGCSGLLNGQANAAAGGADSPYDRAAMWAGGAQHLPPAMWMRMRVLGSFHTSGKKTLDCVQQLDEGMKPRLSGANRFPRALVISLYALAGTRGSDLRSRLNWTIWKEGSEERFCCIGSQTAGLLIKSSKTNAIWYMYRTTVTFFFGLLF